MVARMKLSGIRDIIFSFPALRLTIPLHQELTVPPDSGGMDEIDGVDAEGSNINILLPPGSG